MKTFVAGEIETFLRSLDRQLKEPFRLVVIGGAAAALSFKTTSGTLDIDAANDVSAIETASQTARAETNLVIPLSSVGGVFDAPYEYESRLGRVSISGLRRLEILVPEKHDWALMKIVRLNEKDRRDIREVRKEIGLEKAVFLSRMEGEMTHVAPRKRLFDQFLVMMEELYGPAEADRMGKSLSAAWGTLEDR